MENINDEDRKEINMDLTDLVMKWKKKQIVMRFYLMELGYPDEMEAKLTLRKFPKEEF